MTAPLKDTIDEHVKTAMRARDKRRVGALRLVLAEMKRVEVDERIELDDQRVIAILEKMRKQRQDSLEQYTKADRQDLAEQEQFELDLLAEFLPEPLSSDAIGQIVAEIIDDLGASTMKDMGRVMASAKERMIGQADMAEVSKIVKSRLA